ncbi:MAG: hypothetical protein ACP5NS_03125 [Candidatus Pacearchaeota archaeon]
MASKSVIIISIFVLISLFAFAIFLDSGNSKLSEATGLAVTTETFPVYMETHPLIKDLPSDASISLTIGGQAYGVSGKEIQVDKVINDADISIELPAGYESRIGQVGLCAAVKEAIENGDITIDTKLSKTQLLMKYYKLIKYRSCIEE